MRAAPPPLMSLLGLVVLAGCLPDEVPRGLRATPSGRGPTVVFDLDARPLPDIPFPNDLLARPDGAALTGLRLNLSSQGPTALERRLRTEGLALDGFSGFAPITVRFSAALDLAALDGWGRDPAEDPVLVICVSPQCLGERTPLDLGRGRYPSRRVVPGADAMADPRADAAEVLFETVDEDLDGDGVLDPGEDQDGDGVLDRPNVGPDGRPMSWYERETNTLILRPLRPLRPGATYAVVLTDDVHGADGQPVRSPFAWVHHIEQARQLEVLAQALAPSARTVDEVAFAWTFTVQSAGATMRSVADGLAGAGTLADLAAAFPPDVTSLDRLQTAPDASSLLPGDELAERLAALTPSPFRDTDAAALAAAQGAVSHLVAGRFVSPALLRDDDGLAEVDVRYPADGDEVFRLAEPTPNVGGADVPFWCVVPKADETHQPPFSVVLLVPDHRESRLHSLLWAGAFAAHGLATCTLDGFGQAATLDPTAIAALDALEPGEGTSPLVASLTNGRARDLNNDGVVDPDLDLLGGDVPHARDHVRQTLVDWLQFLRVLRGFDGDRRWAVRRGEGTIAGDFDGDSVPDLGGPTVAVHVTGRGLGGNVAVMLAELDPGIQRVAPVAAGAGLSDVLVRSGDLSLVGAFWEGVLGPRIIGRPGEGGATELAFMLAGPSPLVFAFDEQLLPGDLVTLRNLDNGEERTAVADGLGQVQVAVPADGPDPDEVRARLKAAAAGDDPPRAEELGDRLEIEVREAGGRLRVVDALDLPVERFGARLAAGAPLVALSTGFGLRRRSPRLRRFMDVVQTVLDPADPAHAAPFVLTGGARARDVLVLLTAGDTVIPVSAGLALARALGLDAPDVMDRLVNAGAVVGAPDQAPLVDVGGLGAPDAELALDPPVAPSVEKAGGQLHLRIAWLGPDGAHGFQGPSAEDGGGAAAALADALGRFLATGTPP